MIRKLDLKSRLRFREILISLLTYSGFLGLGYVIALFIAIPQVISYAIFLVFGILAVAIDIPDEKMKWLKLIPLIRRHFFMMHRVRRRIGIAAKEGKLTSAYKFAVGMILVIGYLFFMNLAIISIKLILHFTIDFSDPFRFTEAFLSLLGAGVTAYIIWLRSFHREYKHTLTLIKFKSEKFRERTKNVTKGVAKGFSLVLKLYILFISFIIWLTGECLFMLGTPFFTDYITYFLLGTVGFFAALVLSLIFIVFLTKPDEGLLANDMVHEEKNSDFPAEVKSTLGDSYEPASRKSIFSRLRKHDTIKQ
ncbi:MAG: hypothetical protein JW776_11985 [Candidatus Lokiarchaeota archaeon]|nr:hypothetical protein [Candidatus Lokiarchaeota archaeon]